MLELFVISDRGQYAIERDGQIIAGGFATRAEAGVAAIVLAGSACPQRIFF